MALTRRGRILVALGILSSVVAVPAVAGGLYFRSIGLIGSSSPGKEVAFVIPKGASTNEIGELLERKGVIKSATGFRFATMIESGAEDIQAGRYRLPRGLSARDALEALVDEGPLAEDFVVVTFPEGLWLTEFAARLAEATDISAPEFMNVVESSRQIRSKYRPSSVDTLEGLLFPSTYQIGKKEDARAVAQELVDEFERRVARLDVSPVRSLEVSFYEAVIVASMIEAETFRDEERSKVAAVIYNRLEQGIPLGIDATVLYALGERKRSLSAPDLAIDSPFNTRKVVGLPPTPIGAPGLKSIRAALNPASGDWLYYVLVDCDGRHSFSSSYGAFLRDKATYQNLEC